MELLANEQTRVSEEALYLRMKYNLMLKWIEAQYDEVDKIPEPKRMPAGELGFYRLWDLYCEDKSKVPVFAVWINKVLY